MKWAAKGLAVLFGLGIGLAGVLVIGEIWLRWKTPAAFRVQNNSIILPKNQVYRYANSRLRGCDAQIVHHKNSLGFRGPERPADFDQRLTLIAVGGSTTECFYLSDGRSWPEQLGARLTLDSGRTWVNNAGLDGHSTFGHLILMRDVIAPMRPTVVLFLVGINDVERQDLADFDRALLANNRTGWKQTWQSWSEKSRVIAWGRNLLRALAAQARGLSHGSIDLKTLAVLDVSEAKRAEILQRQTPFLQGYEKRLRELIQIARESGIQPVLITQPALFGTGKDDVSHVDLAAIRVDSERNGRVAWDLLEKYNDATRTVARDQKLVLVDLARELRKSSNYFYDFYHFTNAGAEATASLVYKHLKPMLLKDYSQFFHGK